MGTSGKVEDQDFSTARAPGDRHVAPAGKRGPVAFLERLPIQRCLPAEDLHPCMSLRRERLRTVIVVSFLAG